MSDPVRFPDNKITYSPPSSEGPSEFRGEDAKGWIVDRQAKPYATFDVTKPDGRSPSVVEKLKFYGNIKTVFILIKKDLDSEFVNYSDKPVDVSNGELYFVDRPEIVQLTIYFETTKKKSVDDDSPFEIRLDVFACIEGR